MLCCCLVVFIEKLPATDTQPSYFCFSSILSSQNPFALRSHSIHRQLEQTIILMRVYEHSFMHKWYSKNDTAIVYVCVAVWCFSFRPAKDIVSSHNPYEHIFLCVVRCIRWQGHGTEREIESWHDAWCLRDKAGGQKRANSLCPSRFMVRPNLTGKTLSVQRIASTNRKRALVAINNPTVHTLAVQLSPCVLLAVWCALAEYVYYP